MLAGSGRLLLADDSINFTNSFVQKKGGANEDAIS